MSLRSVAHLEAFYWVARLGSFHAAAMRLGISQPAVSVRLRELERSLGLKLVDRTMPAALTEDGVAALDYAERILSLAQDMEGRLRPRTPLRGMLRFGVSDGFALVCLARFMAGIREGNSDLRVAVTIGNSPVLSRMLTERQLDAAILSNSRPVAALAGAGMQVKSLGFQQIAWVASPGLGLAGPIPPEALLGQQIFTNPPPSHLFTLIMDWFASVGLTPASLSECDSVAVIATLVAAGAGISVLPVCIVERELASGALVRIEVEPGFEEQEIVAAFSASTDAARQAAVWQAARGAVAGTSFLNRKLIAPHAP
jgi:DNA-binding transcriptional LysR family regulator